MRDLSGYFDLIFDSPKISDDKLRKFGKSTWWHWRPTTPPTNIPDY